MKSIRTKVAFPANNPQWTLRGWLYTPTTTALSHPAIIMLPGFSALKEHGLDAFATLFAEAGFMVLIYDHRNFGESDAEIALEVDPWIQIQDIHAAICYLKQQPNVMAESIGLWGTSFAGGHVLMAAIADPDMKAIVAQVPFVRGHHASLQTQKPEKWQALKLLYENDANARASGQNPKMTPVVTRDPSQPAVMKQADAYAFFTQLDSWPNQVTLHSIENSGNYYPIDTLAALTVPTLFVVASQDTVNPTALALEAYEEIKAPKSLCMIPGEHFAPHDAAFEAASQAALSWFCRYLM